LAATGIATNIFADTNQPPILPPKVEREFRAVWITSVFNGDWPSKRNLSTAQQKAELIALLDQAVRLKLNAVIFQVRPSCDAMYDSKIEPWSDSLNGEMGKAPDPYYDPLIFAVDEAHKRGLELHAWFNPYRAHVKNSGYFAPNHVSKTHPEIVRRYGTLLWLDPGEKATRDYSASVVMDVVKRYDIDGVHFDDYFYPYKQRDAARNIIDFPDDGPWQRYQASHGTLSRDDWRRENVNLFIQQIYRAIKAEKPWVKFGISPFGIWQSGTPHGIKGLNAYLSLYADSRKWFASGWVDYFTPQLYWTIDSSQSFPALLKWWAEQNAAGRHLWPGMSVSKSSSEVINEILATRKQPGASGNVLWHERSLDNNNLNEELAKTVYAKPALVPASPWLSTERPHQPKLHVTLQATRESSELKLSWTPWKQEKIWLWVLQKKIGNDWTMEILPGEKNLLVLKAEHLPEAFALSAIDRYGNASAPAVFDGH